MERHLRHAPRAHAGARQARGGARAARAAAPARRAAADGARLGDAAAAGARRLGQRSWWRSTCTRHEAVVEHSDGRVARDPADAEPRGRRGHARPARALSRSRRERWRSTRRRRRCRGRVPLDEDREHATYDAGQVGALLRRGDAGRARARGVPRALPRSLDAGQRLVGLVRPRGQPLLGAGRPNRRRTTSSCATRWTPRRSPSAGGPATRATARAAFYAYAHPAPQRVRRRRRSRRPRPLGRGARRVPARLGRRRRSAADPHAAALDVRALGLPPRLPGLRLGPGARRHCRGHAATGVVALCGEVLARSRP